MSTSKRTIGIVAIVIVIVCALWFAHGRRDDNGAHSPRISHNEPAEAAVATVRLTPASSSITVPGVFQAYQDILVHAEVSGYIQHIFVDIGDHVHTGQVMAILEVPELNAQVKAASAQLSGDKFELQRTKNNVARVEAVHAAVHAEYARLKNAAAEQAGLIAQQELDDAQAKDLSSEANIDAAKSAYDAAEDKLNQDQAILDRYKAMQAYSYVRAPFNGVVTYRYADTGALISAGTDETKSAMPIVRLAQSDMLRLRMPIPASDAEYMAIGRPAVVQVQATGEILHTKIVRFTRSLDRNTRTMLTEVDIPNKDFHLDPGMYATTTFPLKRSSRAMVVPIDGIVEGDQPYVLLVDANDRVVKRPVVLGIQGANFYQVVRGLEVGDRVIVGNQADYQPGEKVTPSPVNLDLTTFKQTVQPSLNPQQVPGTSPGQTSRQGGPE